MVLQLMVTDVVSFAGHFIIPKISKYIKAKVKGVEIALNAG